VNTLKRTTITASLVGIALGAALVGSIAAADPSAAPTTPTVVTTDAPDITVNPCDAAPVPDTRTDVCATPDGQLVPTPTPSAPATAPEESVTTPDASSNWTAQPLPATVNTPTPTPTTGNPSYDNPRECAPWMSPGWANASCLWDMPNPGGTLVLKACEQEDSDNCYWDATIRGNGQGRSFINIRGHQFFEDGK